MPARGTRFGLLLTAILLASPTEGAQAPCVAKPPCHGCGCKGGPGYRGPEGTCVGYRALEKVCGSPPHARCSFENAPGTGENRDCVLGPRRPGPAGEPPA